MKTRTGMRWRRPTALIGAALVLGLAAAPAQAAAPRASAPSPLLLARAGRSDVVYVVAQSCGQPRCLTLWRDAGAGSALVREALPPITSVSGRSFGTLTSLTFVNGSIGLAALSSSVWGAASLWLTESGGRSWRAVPLGAHRSVLSLTTTTTSFDLVTATCPHGPPACSAIRFQRADAERPTFRLGAGVVLANQAGIGRFGASVAAFGPDVWIAEARQDGAPVLAVSTDGGRRFALRAAPKLVAVNTCYLTATSMRSVWAECPTGMMVSFFHSTDAGSTWGVVTLAPQVSGTEGYAFDPVAGELAYAHLTYPGGRLLEVTGRDSTVTRVGAGPSREAPVLAFVNRDDGLAITASLRLGGVFEHLAATRDAGAHWQTVGIP